MNAETKGASTAKLLVGAILLQNSTILLGKRALARRFYPGLWDVFGGHVEQHETVEQALTRELQEELGITSTTFVEVAVIEVEDSLSEGERYRYHLYHVTRWVGTPENLLLEEHSEIRWVPLKEAAELELASPAYEAVFQRLAANGTKS